MRVGVWIMSWRGRAEGHVVNSRSLGGGSIVGGRPLRHIDHPVVPGIHQMVDGRRRRPGHDRPMATTAPTGTPPALTSAIEARISTSGSTGAPDRVRVAASAAPSLIFLAANALGGVRAAILAASIASLVLVAVRHRRGRSIGLLLPLSLLYVAGRAAVGLLSGSDDVYFGVGLVISALVAVAVLGTTVTPTPAASAVIPMFVRYSPATVAHPTYRRVARRVTAVWAAGELAMAAWEAHHLARATTEEFLGLRMLVGWPAMFVLVGMLIFYVRLRLDPVGVEPRPPAHGPSGSGGTGVGQLQECSRRTSSSRGAGGNRTPVRQVVTDLATTIPAPRPRRLPNWRVSGPHEAATAGSFPDVSGLSRRQWSFPTVHPRFCCRAAWIWPRAPLLVTVFLSQSDGEIRLRERTAHSWRFFGCPRLTSLKQLGSQTRLPGPNVETSQPRDCVAQSTLHRRRPAQRAASSAGPIHSCHTQRLSSGW